MSGEPLGAKIRPMTAADVPRVLEIAANLPHAPHWQQSAYLIAIDPASSPRRIALVAVAPGTDRVVGFAVASLIPPQAELETIAIDSSSQRHGIGRLLFASVVKNLQSSGIAKLLLEVRASNQSAFAFYRALGFAETGRRLSYYADPVEDALLLSLALG